MKGGLAMAAPALDALDAAVPGLDPPLAVAVADAHERVNGSRPRAVVLGSTSDARYYCNQFAVPALCYGPRARNIHGVDEAVELASIVAGARVLARLLAAWPLGGLDGRR
jgi:acetylornithine deacetylase